MPLLSKALPFQGCPPLWGPFCDGPSPRWPQPFARSFDSRVFPSPCVSLRLIPPSSPVISRYHPLSHVISPNRIQSHPIASYRTIGLAERPNFAAWTRFLGRPASRLATADIRLSCRIHVSTVFDILTHKGRAQPVTGQAPPSDPKRGGKSPYAPSRRMSSAWRASSSPTVCCILAW